MVDVEVLEQITNKQYVIVFNYNIYTLNYVSGMGYCCKGRVHHLDKVGLREAVNLKVGCYFIVQVWARWPLYRSLTLGYIEKKISAVCDLKFPLL